MIVETAVHFSPWQPVDLTATAPDSGTPDASVDDWAEREQAAAFARAWTNDERDKSSVLVFDDSGDDGVELSASDEHRQAREEHRQAKELAAAWGRAPAA